MDKLDTELQKLYELAKANISDYARDTYSVTCDEVLRAHFILADYFLREGEGLAAPGPRDNNLLVSAVGRQHTGYRGLSKWKDPMDICATLFFGLIKNHPFYDGNKRTAFLIAMYQLEKCGRTPSDRQREFERLALRTADNRLHEYPAFRKLKYKDDREVRTISNFFRRKTRRLDNRYVRVTYRQLEAILKKHGFHYGNHKNNVIDVVHDVEERYGFMNRKKRTVQKKVTQIGCPSISAQVNVKAFKTVLKATGLTWENGFDSQVLFDGAEPFEALIDDYKAPLRRLKNK